MNVSIRPRIGWLGLVLALTASVMPAVLSGAATLRIPGDLLFLAGVIGFLLGYVCYRRNAAPPESKSIGGRVRRWLLIALRVLFLTGVGALFFVAAGRALPPAALVAQDLEVIRDRAVLWFNPAPPPDPQNPQETRIPEDPPPELRVPLFLRTALDRLAREMLAAPYAGERGATLLMTLLSVMVTWAGCLGLGIALVMQRSVILWCLPLLAILLLIGGPGGGGGPQLVLAVFVLLLVAVLADFNRREAGWIRSRIDYSGELNRDTLIWGGLLVLAALVVAWIVPLWPGNPLAEFFTRHGDTPSGLAVLERNIARPSGRGEGRVGISVLPPVLLGVPLSDEPPERVALLIGLSEPLAPGPWPRYWRVRVLNQYNGRSWASDARIEPRAPDDIDLLAADTGILQTIEDYRTDRRIVAALPDIFALDVDGDAERFADGSLSAVTGNIPPDRYRVVSRPQELGVAPPQPPDLGSFLQLPAAMPQRVADLARALTADSRTDLQRAIALETYLRQLPYNYRVAPIPGDGDAVDQFLFSMGEGYCTYYASAMAVMARTLGIPARVAIGYSTGEPQPGGGYVVREANAHAWPELYLDGRWVPFEPTAILPAPSRDSGPIVTGPIVEAAPVSTTTRTESILPWITLMVTAGIAFVLLLIWYPQLRPLPPVDRTLQQLEEFGRQSGIRWVPGATLREYAESLGRLVGPQRAALTTLVDLIERDRYSPTPLSAAEQRRLPELLAAIRSTNDSRTS